MSVDARHEFRRQQHLVALRHQAQISHWPRSWLHLHARLLDASAAVFDDTDRFGRRHAQVSLGITLKFCGSASVLQQPVSSSMKQLWKGYSMKQASTIEAMVVQDHSGVLASPPLCDVIDSMGLWVASRVEGHANASMWAGALPHAGCTKFVALAHELAESALILAPGVARTAPSASVACDALRLATHAFGARPPRVEDAFIVIEQLLERGVGHDMLQIDRRLRALWATGVQARRRAPILADILGRSPTLDCLDAKAPRAASPKFQCRAAACSPVQVRGTPRPTMQRHAADMVTEAVLAAKMTALRRAPANLWRPPGQGGWAIVSARKRKWVDIELPCLQLPPIAHL